MGSSLNKPLADKVIDIDSQSSLIYDPWRQRGDINSTYHSSSSVTHRRRNHRLSPLEKQEMKNVQSLNFAVNDNLLQREETGKTTKGVHMKKTFGKWIICLFLGIIVGCIAYAIKMLVQLLQGLKFHYTNHYVSKGLQTEAFLTFLGINLLYVFLSCLMVIVAGPLSSSSGIPEVKGILNGVKVPESLGFRALFGKIISLILSYSSGLFVGPEGPMIHIGSAVGAAISQFKSSTLGFYPELFLSYRNDRDKRDFISIGSATGLAAAFGAPIGGVLFSLEEVSSFWSRQLTWRTFFTCVIAAFTTNFLLQGIGSSPDMHDTGLLTFGFSRLYLFRYSELLCFCFLGLIGGLVGAFFVFLNIHLNKWRKEKLKKNPYLRLFEVLFVCVITSIVCYYASFMFACRYQSNIIIEPSVCEDQSNTEMVQFFCPDGMYSELGSLLFGNPDQALRRLYSRTNNMFTLPSLLVFTLIALFFSTISSGLWVAGGLFVPMMMVGAGFGRLFGQTMAMWFTGIDSSIYALVGSAAMMAGYCRMTVCIVVIMVELTEGTQYLVPIILAVMISKWVGDFFNESVYEHLMELKYIPFLQTLPPHSTNNIRIADVMSKNVVVLPEVCQVKLLISVLNSNNHSAFPVINNGSGNSSINSSDHDQQQLQQQQQQQAQQHNQRLYRGIILRDHLLVLLFYRVFYRGTGEEIYLDENFNYNKFTTETSKSPPQLSEMEFEPHELESFIDLRPYMNSSGITIHNTFSFVESYKLFRNMGLRHLPVIDINNNVVGIITRKDLL